MKKKPISNNARTFVGSPFSPWLGPLAHISAITSCFGPLFEHPHQSIREVHAGAKERERLCAVLVHAQTIERGVEDLAIVDELLLEQSSSLVEL